MATVIDYLRAKDGIDPLGPARRAIQNPLSSRDAVKAALMMLAGSKEPGDLLLCDKARVILWPENAADLIWSPLHSSNRLSRTVREFQRRLEWVAAFMAGGVTAVVIVWVL